MIVYNKTTCQQPLLFCLWPVKCATCSRTRSTARPPTSPSSRPWPPSRCTWRTLTTGRRGFSRVWGPTWGRPNCAWAPATEAESTSLRRRWVIVHLTASVQTHAGQCWSTRTSFPLNLFSLLKFLIDFLTVLPSQVWHLIFSSRSVAIQWVVQLFY